MELNLIIWVCLIEIIGTFGKTTRIVGGENADIQDFPFSVSLAILNFKSHFCGGTIISNWHIVTAAHCLTKRDHSSMRIYMGSSNLRNSKAQNHTIMHVIFHPLFKKDDMKHDIAIIMLDRCIKFNEYQNKINLPTEDLKTGNEGIITGWGRTSASNVKRTEILQKAATKVLSNHYCQDILKIPIDDELVCVFKDKGIGACYGDSGSPLVSNGELIGIGSRVFDCAVGIPDIYTRIYPYIEFIQSVITISKLLTCTTAEGIL